ncbi:hypothetical protein JTB14_018405 [Gonioctena quinquepunctata]|nr:hypothetical protein JTB14_018405 [Gonioctena quinquepunctata]
MSELMNREPLDLGNGEDWAIFADPANEKQSGLLKLLKKKHPEALELLKETAPGGMEYTVDIAKSSKSGSTEKEKYVYVIPHNQNTAPEDTYHMVDHQGRKKVIVMAPEQGTRAFIRKVMEFQTGQGEIRWTISFPRKTEAAKQTETVKDNVKVEEKSVEIRAMQRTDAEDLLIYVKKGAQTP